ncbi:unnamed protein product [Scytosiphon promiscuus]
MTIRSSSSGRTSSGRRLVPKVLGHPWFDTAIWSIFLLMSLIMVGHNVLLQTWGIGSFASITARIERMGDDTYLRRTPLIDAEGRPAFLQYARTPAGRFMHILPAGLWSVIAPLQISPSFRAKHRTAHRRLGRFFIFMSVSIALGIVPIALVGVNEPGHSVVKAGFVVAISAYFLGAGLLAVCHARNKKFADHRTWMLRHVAAGYSVHLQRLLGHLTWWIFPLVVPGYSDLTEEGGKMRAHVFAAYFTLGLVLSSGLMEVWLRHTSHSGKVVAPEAEQEKMPANRKAD